MSPTLPVAVLVSLVLTPAVRALLVRHDVVDVPNIRSSHATVTPRGGGLAVAAATMVGIAAASLALDAPLVGLCGAALLLGAVGFADDRRGLSPAVRLVAQVVVPATVMPSLLWDWDASGALVLGGAAIAVAWSAGYVNVFNFMDGINGISVVQATAAGITLAILADRDGLALVTAGGLAIAGAALGFAPYNAWRGSIFLGDVGSYFIGSWLASLAVLAVADGAAPTIVLTPFLLYLADTSTTVLRRARRGERLTSAHRDHAYQQLVRRGWSHLQVSGLVGAIIATSCAAMLATADLAVGIRAAVFAAAVAAALGFTLLPATLRRRHPVTAP